LAPRDLRPAALTTSFLRWRCGMFLFCVRVAATVPPPFDRINVATRKGIRHRPPHGTPLPPILLLVITRWPRFPSPCVLVRRWGMNSCGSPPIRHPVLSPLERPSVFLTSRLPSHVFYPPILQTAVSSCFPFPHSPGPVFDSFGYPPPPLVWPHPINVDLFVADPPFPLRNHLSSLCSILSETTT